MMKLAKRKNMRLIDYDYSTNGAYFITICVKDRHELLGKIIVGDDAHIVPNIELSQYGLAAEKYIIKIKNIDKYVIMPNHIHLIIFIRPPEDEMCGINCGTMWASSPTEQSIPQLIKSFKILVSKEIGVSMFQRSYYDHIIRNEAEYKKIWEYIDTNQLKWSEDIYYL